MKLSTKRSTVVLVCISSLLLCLLGVINSANTAATALAQIITPQIKAPATHVEKECKGVEVYSSDSSPYIYEGTTVHITSRCIAGQQKDLSIALKTPLRGVFRLCARGVTALVSYSSEEDFTRKKVNEAVGIEEIDLDLDECRTVRSALVQLDQISVSRIWINPVSQGESTPVTPTIREVSCRESNRSIQLVVAKVKRCYTGQGMRVALDLGREYVTSLCYYGTKGAALETGGSENLSEILVYITRGGCYKVSDLIESSGIQARFLTIYPE